MFSLSLDTLRVLPDVIQVSEDFVLIDNTVSPHVTHLTTAWKDTPVQLDGIIVIFCTSGEIDVKVSLEQYRMRENSVCVVPPGMIIEILSVSRDFHCMMLVMSSNFVTLSQGYAQQMLELFKSLQRRPCFDLEGLSASRYREIMADAIKSARWVENPQRLGMMHSYVYLLFCCLHPVIASYNQQYQQEKKLSSQKELFFRFMELLQSSYQQHHTVQYYADELGITAKYLSKVISQESGNTASSLIENYVILEAKALLKQSNDNIQRIAERLSFPNQNAFGKFFKRMVGMSPKEYREQ